MNDNNDGASRLPMVSVGERPNSGTLVKEFESYTTIQDIENMEISEPLYPHKFYILNPAMVEPYFPDDEIANHSMPEYVRFYDKQNFVAYMRNSTWKQMKDNDEDWINELARAALFCEECELLTDGEYVEDLCEGQFICNYGETMIMDGEDYLDENKLHFEYVGSGMTECGYWEEDEEDEEEDEEEEEEDGSIDENINNNNKKNKKINELEDGEIDESVEYTENDDKV